MGGDLWAKARKLVFSLSTRRSRLESFKRKSVVVRFRSGKVSLVVLGEKGPFSRMPVGTWGGGV